MATIHVFCYGYHVISMFHLLLLLLFTGDDHYFSTITITTSIATTIFIHAYHFHTIFVKFRAHSASFMHAFISCHSFRSSPLHALLFLQRVGGGVGVGGGGVGALLLFV